MAWSIEFTKAATKDVSRLREPARSHVHAMLARVAENPLPSTEGGYGKPLGHKQGGNLTGYFKVKLRGDGLRVVYRLERTERAMIVIIVSIRDDGAVYKEAVRRIQ
ncbi:type II toxin-antitoxin system RelE family toxin [Bifidobacterium callimiconis]|uniref:Toxin RelE n=1 Tax=Bifidobacterium callimiconis TaxID=2306973 RepID=A0A430FBP9_9BIFI|nr:type II toxin-antitoxin system RelE/ParE family toxin [Bifidobacterium callimiconis]RSX50263.1 toxin RelE [Bifidobacterium callimiconis]